MPNWCSTSLAVFSKNEQQVRKLYNALESISANPSRIENGFGNLWLGNVLEYHGISYQSVHCRGSIIDYSTPSKNLSGVWHMFIYTEDAWGPMLDVWNIVLGLSYYEDLHYVHYAEEPGCGCYETSDSDGDFFPERFFVELNYCDKFDNEQIITRYFETEEDLFNDLNNIVNDPTTGFNVTKPAKWGSIEEAKDFFSKICQESSETGYAEIVRIEVVE